MLKQNVDSCQCPPSFVGVFLLQEDRILALQRQSLRQRHLPGSDDRVGEDPLAPLVGGTTSTWHGQEWEPGEFSNDEGEEQNGGSVTYEPPAGPVRLELGMDPEVLDTILDEIEVRELSRVIRNS